MPSLRQGPFLFALLLAAAAGCSETDRKERSPVGDATPPTYVGRAKCAGCHELQHELYTGSHHDLAMQPVSEGVLGDFDGATFEHFGALTKFTMAGGKPMVNTDGPDGEPADYEVAYSFGVEPLQQYLVEMAGGRMQALSVSWDSRPAEEGGQRWMHLYDEPIPAGDLLHWTGRYQNWNFMCAECHSTNLVRNYDVQTDTYATTFSEVDVSCEACHGPGSRHVAWEEAYEAGEEPGAQEHFGLVHSLKDDDDGRWVIDIETGNAERRPPRSSRAEVETCAPCHSRRSPVVSQHTPGDAFLDGYRPALLDEGLYFPDGQIQDEVYVWGSFVQSTMYKKGVTCNDCHEPHSGRTRFPGNDLCGQCHFTEKYDTPEHHRHIQGSVGAECVECHMPTRTYMVVDDRRDHSLRVPRPDLSVKLGTPNACNRCHVDQSAQWAANAVEEWRGDAEPRPMHYGEALHAARADLPSAEMLLANVAGDPEAPVIVRATALAELAGHLGPNSAQVVGAGLADEEPLVRLGAVMALEGLPAQDRLALGVSLLVDPVRAVRLEAARVFAGTQLNAVGGEGRAVLDRAFDEYQEAQLVSAERPESHMNLGVFEVDRRRLAEAERAYRTALRLEPSFVQAYLNLADLYREQGREDEAETTLREALSVAPDDGFAHHSLGLLLVRRGKLEEAATELGRAASLAPEVARFGYVHAICLAELKETQLALTALDEVHRRHPNDRDVVAALATMNRDAGNVNEAVAYAQKLVDLLPGDPSARALLEQVQALRDE